MHHRPGAGLAANGDEQARRAYAKNGKVVCYFQSSHKFKYRYATLGFSDQAILDSGAMWPVTFALKELTPTAEKKIKSLLKKALGGSSG